MQQQKLEAQKLRQRLAERLQALYELLNKENKMGPENYDKSRWQRSRSFRLMAEYLLQKGHQTSALLLAQQHDLESHIDYELYSESRRIEESLLCHCAADCLAWCSENRAVLKKNKSPLEFVLRRQEFIELTRSRDLLGAISYARKHFPAFIESNEREIEQAFALLAIGYPTQSMPYSWLYDLTRWKDIADLFGQESRSLHGLPNRPQLEALLLAGLAALKTHQCSRKDKQATKNIDCPVCNAPLNAISEKLPFSHHETSRLVCPVTGSTMDADNAPMVLPNGYIYSQRALEKMAESNGGFVLCPRTNCKFRLSEARKCYIS